MFVGVGFGYESSMLYILLIVLLVVLIFGGIGYRRRL